MFACRRSDYWVTALSDFLWHNWPRGQWPNTLIGLVPVASLLTLWVYRPFDES